MMAPITVEPREPIELQAWQVTRENAEDVASWADGRYRKFSNLGPRVLLRVDDPNDLDIAEPGDYVVRGVTGRVWALPAEEFHATYVEVEKGSEARMSCIFCDIVAGSAPARFVSTTSDGVVAFHPLGPVTPGHLLFVPRVHVTDAATDVEVTAAVFAEAARHAATLGCGGPFNLITSAGREATQSVFHLHVHYVPRAKDDGLMVPWGTAWGENPQDPHRCKKLIDLERRVEEGVLLHLEEASHLKVLLDHAVPQEQGGPMDWEGTGRRYAESLLGFRSRCTCTGLQLIAGAVPARGCPVHRPSELTA